MVAVGFIVAAALALHTGKIFNVSQDMISNLSLIILISGIIGARIMYVALNLGDFISMPSEAFKVWHGGLVFYGGVIFALISGIVYLKISKSSILILGDVIVPFAALAHSIGRIGCFLNGCCFGKTTSSFLGIVFQDGITRHPTQIYESAYLLFLYMFLRAVLQFKRFNGQVFFLYLIFYSVGRFFIEYLRADAGFLVRPTIGNFTPSQTISLIMFIFGLCGYQILGLKRHASRK
jgi:phosphatidylglycerol:prolipoprotein diacylglycerol transferase